MKFKKFSSKQLSALNWWLPESPNSHLQGIICDGAVRSGKTSCLSLSFLLWSFWRFSGGNFALCGKTIRSLERNLVTPLIETGQSLGFKCNYLVSKNLLTISHGGRFNRFYLFGGKDEASSSLIQGITLCGVLFDEVALMPRSFVEQALARCSVQGSKFWFNCNPQHPSHWFFQEWIAKADSRGVYYLHFSMSDNPSLSSEILSRYEQLFSGVFYERFVKGRWVAGFGAVYPMFSEGTHVAAAMPDDLQSFVISCDYGTRNPTSMGLWGYSPTKKVWYRSAEFYHDSRSCGTVKTDEEYLADLLSLADGKKIEKIIVDPSAASFIQSIKKNTKFKVIHADNRVLDGIRCVSSRLSSGEIKIHHSCRDCIREFELYRWDTNSKKDSPLKENDHAMDDLRYFVTSIFAGSESPAFYVSSSGR